MGFKIENMTAKEKAKEFVENYWQKVRIGNKPTIVSFKTAKQCSLIAVYEIMQEARKFDEYYVGETSDTNNLRVTYWQQVKTEIELL